LKNNIMTIEDSLEKIMKLIPVEYDWKEEAIQLGIAPTDYYGKHDIGFIAQNAKEVLPQSVHTADDGYLRLSYSRVVPLIIEAIKEEQANIDRLEEEINLLRQNNK